MHSNTMASRPAKLRRISAVGVSHAKLVELIARIRADPLDDDEKVDRWVLRRSLDELWRDTGCTIRLPTNDGEFSWDCLSISKALHKMVSESIHFKAMLRDLFRRVPCTETSPFHLVVYADEATPGNVLRLDNKRKVMCIYVTIREFGPRFLKHEVCWIPVGIIRSSVLKKIAGGFSTCLRLLLRQWFFELRLHEQGVCLDLGLEPHRFATFFLKLGNILADGDAYRALWSVKGASGNVPCIMCKNVVAIDDIRSDRLVHFSHHDRSRFLFASCREIWAKADAISAAHGNVSRAEFDRLQMVHGLTYSPSGLLWDAELREHVRPTSSITFDSMHITVANGVVQNETGWLLSALKQHGITWSMVSEFCRRGDWRFCKASGSKQRVLACFPHTREEAWKSSGVFRASASEMLMVYPILMHFLDKVVRPRGIMGEQILSYEELGTVLDCIRRGKAGEAVHPQLARIVELHLLHCKAAYPEESFKPKNHYLHHIPLQLARDGVIIDAFVGERKNGVVKRLSSDIQNTRAFEKSCILKVLAHQLDDLGGGSAFEDRLFNSIAFDDLGPSAFCSKAFMLHGTSFYIGDVFLQDAVLWLVEAGIEKDGNILVAARRGHLHSTVSPSSSRWTLEEACQLVDFGGSAPRMVDAWYFESDGSCVALCKRR